MDYRRKGWSPWLRDDGLSKKLLFSLALDLADEYLIKWHFHRQWKPGHAWRPHTGNQIRNKCDVLNSTSSTIRNAPNCPITVKQVWREVGPHFVLCAWDRSNVELDLILSLFYFFYFLIYLYFLCMCLITELVLVIKINFKCNICHFIGFYVIVLWVILPLCNHSINDTLRINTVQFINMFP